MTINNELHTQQINTLKTWQDEVHGIFDNHHNKHVIYEKKLNDIDSNIREIGGLFLLILDYTAYLSILLNIDVSYNQPNLDNLLISGDFSQRSSVNKDNLLKLLVSKATRDIDDK